MHCRAAAVARAMHTIDRCNHALHTCAHARESARTRSRDRTWHGPTSFVAKGISRKRSVLMPVS